MKPTRIIAATAALALTLPLSAEDWQKEVAGSKGPITLTLHALPASEACQFLFQLGGLTAKAHFYPATAGEVKIDLVLSGASTAEGIAEIEKQANLEVSYQEDGIHFAPRSFKWTSSDGKVIQAKFIKLEGDFVTLDVGGQQHKFPLARLSPESMAQAKKLYGASPALAIPPSAEAGSQPSAIAPSPSSALLGPDKILCDVKNTEIGGGSGDGMARYVACAPNGAALFLWAQHADGKSSHTLVSVSLQTGKVLWRMPVTSTAELSDEFNPDNFMTEDGWLIVCMVNYRFDPADANKQPEYARNRLAQIVLHVFDGSSGKLQSRTSFGFDNPESSAVSGPVMWSSHGCVQVARRGSRNLLVNGYFAAELNAEFTKATRVCRFPDRTQTQEILDEGAVGTRYERDATKTWVASLNDQSSFELPSPKTDWKVVGAGANQGGWLTARFQVSGQGPPSFGGYQISIKSWVWTKSPEDWSVIKPGAASNLQYAWESKRNEGLIFDVTSGELKCRYPGNNRVHLVPNNKAWIFAGTDLLLVNCATNQEEARITMPKPHPDYGEGDVITLSHDRLLIIQKGDGGVEILLADGAKRSLSAARKLTSEVPFQQVYVKSDVERGICLISDPRAGFCAIPLPEK
jgi:hypothetical protein